MPPPRHAQPSRFADSAPRYLGALIVATLAVGTGAVHSSSTPPPRPVAEPTASIRLTSQVTPQVVVKPPVVEAAPVTPAVKKPAPKPVRKKPAPAKKVHRYLPVGTGMWLHEYESSQGGNGAAIVARSRAAGLTHLYVQTGSSKKGAIGGPALRSLLPATRGTGLRVIAWDFANLRNPEADARRLALAARFRCAGCPRVAAVAPDIETAAEGTSISGRNVIRYYRELRHWLPADVAILATVPWPSEKRVGHYPYAATAALVDAILPMAYWYNRDPAVVTAQSMAYLKRFHKPVMPVGQGYDSRVDAPYLAPDPHPFLSVRAFLLTAHKWGARSVSLWSWQTTGSKQWSALKSGRSLYRK